jgi:GDP-L-fucose synthase
LALKEKHGLRVRAVGGRRLPRVLGANIDPLRADLSDPAAVTPLFRDIDYVFVCAGVLSTAPVLAADPFRSVLTTLRVSVNAIEAAWRAGVRRCVLVSSTCGYPESDKPLTEEQMFQGEPPAQWHALGGMTRYLENLCISVSERAKNPLAMTVLRPSLVYGEYDHFDDNAHFLPALIRRVVAREKPLEVWGDGSQQRDLVHAEDVIRAGFMSLTHSDPLITANICAGRSHSVNDVLTRLIEADGFVDAQVRHRIDRPQTAALRRFDGKKAVLKLGFRPKIGLSEGILRTLTWYRETRL